eukprot:jgi/Undpi1/3432/HiC_scaffold_16.g06805.m1
MERGVNALGLEIQAALARGDALGDSDSDEAPEKKPPKISRPAGSNPNNLLSLLPKPSTTTSVDDILLNGKISRATTATPGAPDHAVTSSPPGGGGGGGGAEYAAEEEKEKEPDSDGDGDDLLASIYAKTGTSGASAGSGSSNSISTPLFTLPSRAKPGGAVGAALLPDNGKILDEEGAGVGVIPGIEHGGMPPQMEKGSQGQCAGQWGEMPQGEGGLAYAWQEGEASQAAAAETGGGAYEMAYGASVEQYQQQQQAPYNPGVVPGAANFGAQQGAQQGSSTYEDDFGSAGGKASRRKGRDMERALARGDLGALGNKLPVMDLHQGSNEYNPLRSKPMTAAMKQDQKHIEGSVYDPHTGQTMKTLEPTSMQKRKHQINQLAVQAASMERDLMERSGASRLTKAQTHAKYGW